MKPNLRSVSATPTTIALAFLTALGASALSLSPSMAKSFTKAQCIEEAYKVGKQKQESINAVLVDTYCSCKVANQKKMSAAIADEYCAGLAKESMPKDPAAERAKMLLIEQMMAPRQPTVIDRFTEQYMYNLLKNPYSNY